MDRRSFLKTIGLAGAAASCGRIAGPLSGTFTDPATDPAAGHTPKRIERPNILFIVTDQQHAGMMGCAGNRWLKTPAMDSLAASGTRFERAYATNPVCVPSRFSFQTGRMPSAVGMRLNQSNIRVPDHMLSGGLGPVLRREGYRTAFGGKVHLPKNQEAHLFSAGYEMVSRDQRDRLAEDCAEFIARPHDRPFMLFASFINPHDICYMAINDHARSRGKPPVRNVASRICERVLDEARKSGDLKGFIRDNCPPLPANFEPPEGEPECITTRYTQARQFRQYARERWGEDEWRLHRWLYCRLTERVDRQVGRVLSALADAGLEESTLVVFTSDHGDHDGAHRLEHKSILYEEAARIPFIMRLPGAIPAGRVDDTHLVSNGLDLLPTLADYAGATPPDDLPGMSVRGPAERGKAPEWREHVVCESQNGRMVRGARYKYCVYDSGARRETLVDLAADPGEMTNLVSSPQHRRELDLNRRVLREWTDRVDDRIGRAYLIPEGA
jgi:choline-sulfatase